ncbi:MAG: agmatine deiminase family protein [Marinilabilia sp.]
MNTSLMPAEWHFQEAVLLAWPHPKTDWGPVLGDARDCFSRIIDAVARFQSVIVLLNDEKEDFPLNNFRYPANIYPFIVPTNDTWARDFGPLVLKNGTRYKVLDFKFDGWGLKFAADKDNLVTRHLFRKNIFAASATYENHLDFVLEGGSIESDGEGTILTTSKCLLSPNRNGSPARERIEDEIKTRLGAKRVLWIDHGHLAGDDTDSHIDTLARFCNSETIAYVKCDDPDDNHFDDLRKMEQQLKEFITAEGHPYNLIPLPMAEPVKEEGCRLPATYANFLIINGAVLVPFYGSSKDALAKEALKEGFPEHEIIGIDCRPLIRQHGSLHCVTMQFPKGVLNKKTIRSVTQKNPNHAQNRPYSAK